MKSALRLECEETVPKRSRCFWHRHETLLACSSKRGIIYSKKDGNIAIRRISASHISEHNTAEVLKFHSGSFAFEVCEDKFIEGDWSTMILLEDLHGARRFMSMNKSLQDLFPVKSKK